ncbi:hypothetical protein [Aquimarina rhabdastrellae]
MKKIIKSGLNELPLVYQLAEINHNTKEDSIDKNLNNIRSNRFISIKKYNSKKTYAFTSPKPVSKIF